MVVDTVWLTCRSYGGVFQFELVVVGIKVERWIKSMGMWCGGVVKVEPVWGGRGGASGLRYEGG